MRQNAEALEVLNECDRLVVAAHGDASLQRVPICHAMAEVHEAEGKPQDMQKAVAALQRARELRRAALGEAHLSYAFSCIQEAALLVRIANEALMMVDSERARLTDQAVGLALAAHAAAGECARRAPRDTSCELPHEPWRQLTCVRARVAADAGDEAEGMEFLDTLLEAILRSGSPNRLGKLPQCAKAIQQLRDAGAELHTSPEDAEEEESEVDEEDANAGN